MLLFSIVNTLCQDSYSDAVNKCDPFIRKAVCPSCGKSHGMEYHGSYKRLFRSSSIPEDSILIRIRRCRCKGCGATHAIFFFIMIPFFRITLSDACTLLSTADSYAREKTAVDLSMDDDSIRYLSNRYHFYWKDKVILPTSSSCLELAMECFSSFKMWFLKKMDPKRKVPISVVPTRRSCPSFAFPLII